MIQIYLIFFLEGHYFLDILYKNILNVENHQIRHIRKSASEKITKMREKRGVPLWTAGVHADLELPAVVLTAVQRVNGVLGVALLVVPGAT